MRRNRALQRAGWRCERCDAKRDLQVHHKTYERLYREWDQDLEVVCSECHRGEHIDQAIDEGLGIYFKVIYRVRKEFDAAESFADLSESVKQRLASLRIPCDPYRLHRVFRLMNPGGDPTPIDPVAEPQVAQWRELAKSGPPCACEDCSGAGVSHLRQHRDADNPPEHPWMHGERLRQHYARLGFFQETVRRVIGGSGRHGRGFERLAVLQAEVELR